MTTTEAADDECLHCKINALVEDHVKNHDPIDVMELALKMAESLAELIQYAAPKEEHATLLARTMAHLGAMFIEKAGVGEGDTTH